MKPIIRTLPNIPISFKTGKPENWKNWTKERQDAYLDATIWNPIKQKTGLNMKAEILKSLSRQLITARIQLDIAKKLNSPSVTRSIERRISAAIEAATARLKARRQGAGR